MIVRIFKNYKKSTFHRIPKNPVNNSMAGYLLLKSEYQKKDEDIRFRLLGHRAWLTFRNSVVNKIKKKNKGVLTCVYCGSSPLVSNFNAPGVPKRRKATLDHLIPRSRGGSEISLANIVIACSTCNQKKDNKIV